MKYSQEALAVARSESVSVLIWIFPIQFLWNEVRVELMELPSGDLRPLVFLH